MDPFAIFWPKARPSKHKSKNRSRKHHTTKGITVFRGSPKNKDRSNFNFTGNSPFGWFGKGGK